MWIVNVKIGNESEMKMRGELLERMVNGMGANKKKNAKNRYG